MKSTSIKMFVLDVGVWDCSPGKLLGKLVHDFVHILDFAVKMVGFLSKFVGSLRPSSVFLF